MRVWNDKGFVPYRLEVLTPVHIGGGEALTPLEYVVRNVRESDWEIWLIDTVAWLGANHAKPEIGKALDEGDMGALRGLLSADPGLARFRAASVDVGKGLGKELAAKCTLIESTAEISFFIRNPFTHLPYVPASSIKGAISTALIDYLNAQPGASRLRAGNQKDPGEYRKKLESMFGKITEHAMQGLRMGDVPLPPGVSRVCRAIGVGLDPSESMAKTPCEALDPGAVNADGIYGNLRFALVEGMPCIDMPGHWRVSVSDLGKICNDFYRARFLGELEKFYKKPHLAETGKALESARKRIEALAEGEFLLRIGHYSHIECMMVAGEPPQGVFKKGYGTTRTLAERSLPFGWVILRRCDLEEYNKGVEAVLEAINSKDSGREAEAEAARKREEEKAAAKEREEAARRERENMLASMSAEEREIWQLEQPDALENLASEICNKLDGYGELQPRAAQALKQFWQRLGKWEGKSLTKKQKEKVAKVRAILGE